MARQRSWAMAVVLFGLLGCGNQGGPLEVPPDIALEIYLASGFRDEPVEILLDGTLIYSGIVSTQPFSGPAAALYTTRERGAHQVGVLVGEQNSASAFVLTAPTYVIIVRDEHQQLRITVTSERPLWL